MSQPEDNTPSANYFPSDPLLNFQHEQFAQLYVNSDTIKGNATACYREVYGNAVKNPGIGAHRLMKNKKVILRNTYLIKANQKKLQRQFRMNRDEWLTAWEAMVKDGKRDSLQATSLQEYGKAQGYYQQLGGTGSTSTFSVNISINTSGRKQETIEPVPAVSIAAEPVAEVDATDYKLLQK
jgi:hypothetical protein